jgi:hypothetical protein
MASSLSPFIPQPARGQVTEQWFLSKQIRFPEFRAAGVISGSLRTDTAAVI